jgi:hypothetical protein
MIKVSLKGVEYSVANETLDWLFLDRSWEHMAAWPLTRALQRHVDAGRVVIDGRRLRAASPLAEAEHRLQVAEDPTETMREGFLYLGAALREAHAGLAARLETLGEELRELREVVTLQSAASEPLTRDDASNADGRRIKL